VPGRTSTVVLLAVAVVLAGAGYWAVKVRERASAATVLAHVRDANPGASVGCAELRGNGSVWACAAVYRAEYLCELAKVSLTGSISLNPERRRCAKVAQLAAMVPARPTPEAVAADATLAAPGKRFTCVQPGGGTSRWLCARPAGGVPDCRIVRLLPWQPLKLEPGGVRCLKFPALAVG
jgi:hypothetical protein